MIYMEQGWSSYDIGLPAIYISRVEYLIIALWKCFQLNYWTLEA